MSRHIHRERALSGISITAGNIVDHHYIQDHTILVNTALQSVALTNPSLAVDIENKVVYLDVEHPSQVSVISGGGSGHEPSFSSFVGRGLLAASVTGKILQSPEPSQIEAALLKVDNRKGILVIIMNNIGDVSKFKTAILKARASGLRIELVVVGDDVSCGRIETRQHGRGGIAGTVLVIKIAGALAASGVSLEEVTRVARLASSHLSSIGNSLSHVRIPNHVLADSQSDEYLVTERVGADTGLGEHILPGSHKSVVDLPGIIDRMLKELLDWQDEDRSYLTGAFPGDLVMLVNNLGGLSGLELGAITLEIARQLQKTYKIEPVRIYSGTFMSSLNELGFSISLLRVQELELAGGQSMLNLLDAPSETTGWPSPISASTWAKAGTK